MPLSHAALWLALAAGCFHAAYSGPWGVCIFGFLFGVIQLAGLPTPRQAFYAGLAAGALCYPVPLRFFWGIFGTAAAGLWLVLMLWLALFVTLAQAARARLGGWWAAALIPCLWMGLEYFRSELYPLRFSWLNIGYAYPHAGLLGVYGAGFLAAWPAAGYLTRRWPVAGVALGLGALALLPPPRPTPPSGKSVTVAGRQMEFPPESALRPALDLLEQSFPGAELLVLSEYTLSGPVPEPVKAWCRDHRKYLVLGGKDPLPGGGFYNTAFVVGPAGHIEFQQAKSVPLPFFADGLPAREQQVWDSPWGKLGICICYDLSYRRVLDRLVRLGAEGLIVPTMDVEEWGEQEHELHRRVALMRATEYGLPIFRVASSGVSQLVNAQGEETATAPFAAEGAMLTGSLQLSHGRMPIDAFLAPVCVGITGAFIGWIIGVSWRSRRAAGS